MPCSQIKQLGPQDLLYSVAGIDWNRVAEQHVPTRSGEDCRIQWIGHDHPLIQHTEFTAYGSEARAVAHLMLRLTAHTSALPACVCAARDSDERTRLKALVKQHGERDWAKIASELNPHRTALQWYVLWPHHVAKQRLRLTAASLRFPMRLPLGSCREYNRMLYRDRVGLRTGWTAEQDEQLRRAVAMYGESNWQQVAAAMPGRTGQQCLHRWQKSINPKIRRARWTPEEDKLLMDAVKLYGHAWSRVQHHVPNRTDVQCRERWMNILNPELQRTSWTPEVRRDAHRAAGGQLR